MAFLGGLLSALAPMVPGIVSTIGDIAGKIFNRGNKGIGETLLEAAPSALGAISKVAAGVAPAIGGTAGNVLGKVADIASHFEKPMSMSATDHLPMVHGNANHPMTSQSGPLSLQGSSPAQAYQNDSTQSMSDNMPYTGPMQPHPQYSREERGIPFSHGVMPSFNIFDKLAPKPIAERKIIEETLPEEEPVKTIIRYIKRKETKKAKKKAKRRK